MKSRTEQLDGWKEIACHLKRSVRSVQRWERNEKLPVRRHEHAHGVSVYAFSNELEAWWQNERRSSKLPSSNEISGTTSENRTTKGSAGSGEARIQGAGTPDCGESNGIQTGFELASQEIAIVIFLLSLLKGMRLAEICEMELQAIGARYELDQGVGSATSRGEARADLKSSPLGAPPDQRRVQKEFNPSRHEVGSSVFRARFADAATMKLADSQRQ